MPTRPATTPKTLFPLKSFLDSAQLTMATSNERHINVSASALESPRSKQDRSGETAHSGNNVSLENELLKLGETNSQFALNTGLIKSFNRMIMASLKITMGDALISAMKTSASGLEAQSMRVRIISENLANAQSTGSTPGSDPFRRKTITFGEELDRMSGATLVDVKSVQTDQTALSDWNLIPEIRLPTRRAMSKCQMSI